MLAALREGEVSSGQFVREGIHRFGARICELRKAGYNIVTRRDSECPTLFWYSLEE